MRVYLFWCIPLGTEYDDWELSTANLISPFPHLSPVSILIDGLLWLPGCSVLMTVIIAFWFCILSFCHSVILDDGGWSGFAILTSWVIMVFLRVLGGA